MENIKTNFFINQFFGVNTSFQKQLLTALKPFRMGRFKPAVLLKNEFMAGVFLWILLNFIASTSRGDCFHYFTLCWIYILIMMLSNTSKKKVCFYRDLNCLMLIALENLLFSEITLIRSSINIFSRPLTSNKYSPRISFYICIFKWLLTS